MSPRISVAHISPSYLPVLGGKEAYIYDVVEGLTDVEFLILSGRVWGLRIPDEHGRVRVRRVGPTDLYRGPHALPSPGRVERLLGQGLSVLRLVRQRQIAETADTGLIHSHWSDVDFAQGFRGLASEATQRRLVQRALRIASFRKPTVFTDHSMFLQDLSVAERQLLEHALRAYDEVVCVEPEGATRAREMAQEVGGSANIEYIPNSVNCYLFRPVNSPEEAPKTICYLGRANKGYYIVFDLIRRLKEFRFLLVVAGDRRSLKKWQGVVSDRIRLRENVPPWELPSVLRQAHVVVSPLLHPAITRVTLEALACGVPVVAAAGESRYPLIDGKTGFLVQPDPEAFERSLRLLLSDLDLAQEFGLAGRRIVQREFSDDVVLPRLRSVYRRLALG